MIYLERASSDEGGTTFRVWEVGEDGEPIRQLMADGTWRDARGSKTTQTFDGKWQLWRLQL